MLGKGVVLPLLGGVLMLGVIARPTSNGTRFAFEDVPGVFD